MDAGSSPVSYTHLRAHETVLDLVCRLLLEKKKDAAEAPHLVRDLGGIYQRSKIAILVVRRGATVSPS